MEPLAPIPTPPAQRWREFRIRALPVLTFLSVLLCVVLLWRDFIVPTNIMGGAESKPAGVVADVSERVQLSGDKSHLASYLAQLKRTERELTNHVSQADGSPCDDSPGFRQTTRTSPLEKENDRTQLEKALTRLIPSAAGNDSTPPSP